MFNSEYIKKKAREFGATLCGIGDIKYYDGDNPQRNPLSILPHAKCIIGLGVRVPSGIYRSLENGNALYTYPTLGVKSIDEEYAEVLLLRMAGVIENEGYDACVQRYIPGIRIQGDKTTNPEVSDTYELKFASAVEPGKPVPDVIIDYEKAAWVCGLGEKGLHGKVITKNNFTFMRWSFIITDAPLECDAPFSENMCDGCGECIKACPGHAIDENGLDTWQCSVYYKGAHKSNPYITENFLKDNPEREAILNGEKRFNAESAREIYPELDFLPKTQYGYVACLCGKKCELACRNHIKAKKEAAK